MNQCRKIFIAIKLGKSENLFLKDKEIQTKYIRSTENASTCNESSVQNSENDNNSDARLKNWLHDQSLSSIFQEPKKFQNNSRNSVSSRTDRHLRFQNSLTPMY